MTILSRRTTALAMADEASSYLVMALVAVVLVSSLRESYSSSSSSSSSEEEVGIGKSMRGRSCDEIYVVGEGETLHTISDKCGDPFIVERNPHIHDPDDVFPGLVIMLSPSPSSKHTPHSL